MDEGLKKRLVGAAVLASLVVIFVPMLLDRQPILEQGLQQSNIPPRPEREFSSRVLPSESDVLSRPPSDIVPAQSGAASPPMAEKAAPPPSQPQGSREAAIQAPELVPELESAPPPQRTALSSWVIQVASFSSRENADNLVKMLRAEKFDSFVEPAQVKGKKVYRVRVGPEIDRRQADETLLQINRLIRSQKLKATLTTYP